MTCCKREFVDFTPIHASVEVAGSKRILVEGIDTIEKDVETDHGVKRAVLRNVYYIPSVQFNLFSIKKQLSREEAERMTAF